MTARPDNIARPFDHNARRNGRWDLLCGCRIVNAGQSLADQLLVTGELAITWCPTHAQAPAMLAALRAIVEARCDCDYDMMPAQHARGLKDAGAILRTLNHAGKETTP